MSLAILVSVFHLFHHSCFLMNQHSRNECLSSERYIDGYHISSLQWFQSETSTKDGMNVSFDEKISFLLERLSLWNVNSLECNVCGCLLNKFLFVWSTENVSLKASNCSSNAVEDDHNSRPLIFPVHVCLHFTTSVLPIAHFSNLFTHFFSLSERPSREAP